MPDLQWFHLTGPIDVNKVLKAYAALKLKALVHPFFAEMELALGAATAAVSRAGASSLAELAAMRVPAVLVPYPPATDNHQFHNARAFEATGAARLLEQKTATPEMLVQLVLDLLEKPAVREKMQSALARWHTPRAAEQIAEAMLVAVGAGAGEGYQAHPQSSAPPRSHTAKTRDTSQASWPPQADRFEIGHTAACETPLPAGRGS
jgi:UDP-N-acetylglucosamine--N-acetylmuramyl-(pentapeptide) pyrophosphoryl-undecaprenol N-acetylglucosamine transferase